MAAFGARVAAGSCGRLRALQPGAAMSTAAAEEGAAEGGAPASLRLSSAPSAGGWAAALPEEGGGEPEPRAESEARRFALCLAPETGEEVRPAASGRGMLVMASAPPERAAEAVVLRAPPARAPQCAEMRAQGSLLLQWHLLLPGVKGDLVATTEHDFN